MKIAIFENEYDTIEVAFKYTNKKYYNGLLDITNFPRSQSFKNKISDLNNYDLIIIDLDLSSNSELDGFGLIKEIEKEFGIAHPKMLILTGQDLEENFHLTNHLNYTYPVLEKPINYQKLKNKFDEMGII
tara:strand:- start:227 stop:616 length:390 start_codon:yes stop_codon:yes gene_type:complete